MNDTIKDVKDIGIVERTNTILTIKAIEQLNPGEDGVELNEGYQFIVNGPIPQLADGLAKMIFEMNQQEDLGQGAGEGFLSLIVQYYERLKGGE